MNHADLISSGMTFFAESMLWLWTAILLTIGYVVLRPSLSNTAPRAATITSTRVHGSEELTSARSLSEALPPRPPAGRNLRPIQ
jgi:hypothetical protein